MKKIAVIIPCHNEEETIGEVVKDFKKNLPNAEIFVCDNNSTDDTCKVAKKMGATIYKEPHLGKGNVIRTMLNKIDADCYLLTDGDGAFSGKDATSLIRPILDNESDMVIGDRSSSTYFSKNKRHFCRFGNNFVNFLVNFLFRAHVKDVMTGYRALSKEFAKSFPAATKGFETETEMTIFAINNNFRVKEVPVDCKDRPEGNVSRLKAGRDGLKITRTIFWLFMKKVFSVKNLKILATFLIPTIFLLLINNSIDNDSWDVLAEGRQIVENGIYYTDTLSMHEGLGITVQNYGFAVIFYSIYQVFGAPGLYVGMLLLNFVIVFLLYKICMLISKKNLNLSLLIVLATDFLLMWGFGTTRAQMVSYVIFLGLIYALELYIKTDKSKYLIWLPILSVLQINLHASLWWMLILVWIVYMIDSVKKPKLHLQGYRKKPLIIAGTLMILSGLLNPYGLKMITFIFASYGDGRFQGMVRELSHFSPFRSTFSAFLYLAMVIVMILYAFGNKKNVRARYLLMFFGFLALGLNTVKGLSQPILVMFFPLALLYKDTSLGKPLDMAKIGRDALVFWGGVVSVAIFVSACPVVVSRIENRPDEVSEKVMDVIDENVGEQNKKDLKIYAGYNDGGYVEYRGYKPYLDPRGEVFLKKNNGKEDILHEWMDFKERKISVADFLDKYKFDYIWSVKDSDQFYDFEDENYTVIFADEDNGVKVFRKDR